MTKTFFSEQCVLLFNSLDQYNFSEQRQRYVKRILFFKLIDKITFRQYYTSRPDLWRNSTLVNDVIENHSNELLSKFSSETTSFFDSISIYFQSASKALSYIQMNSGPSIIIYYVLEMMGIVKKLCDIRKDIQMAPCIAWIMIESKTKHLLCVGNFLFQFILQGKLRSTFYSSDELGLFMTVIAGLDFLLSQCKSYNKRIDTSWVQKIYAPK